MQNYADLWKKKMKTYFCLFIWALLFAAAAQAQSPTTPTKPTKAEAPTPAKSNLVRYKLGDELHVHARAGLTLRQTPCAAGVKTTTIPYDQSVVVIALPAANGRYVAEKYGTYEIVGYWPKVRMVDGTEGYAFDGYLSVYPTMKEDPEDGMDYGDAFYGMISKRKGPKQPLTSAEPGMVNEYSYSQAFEDGTVYTSKYYEGGATYLFDVPKGRHTVPELLVMLRSFFYQKGVVKTEWKADEKLLLITEKEGYSYLKIKDTPEGIHAEFAVAD
jgi:hypothetical protein